MNLIFSFPINICALCLLLDLVLEEAAGVLSVRDVEGEGLIIAADSRQGGASAPFPRPRDDSGPP